MSTQTIGAFAFVEWDGPPPQLVRPHAEVLQQSGQSLQTLISKGTHGDPFNVNLRSVFANQADANTAATAYQALISSIQVVTYNGVNYQTTYANSYAITGVEINEVKRFPRLIGPTYDFPLGWQVRSSWTLHPVVV